jgi:CxxC-x17-CxxC domain-containing protein
MKNFKRNKDFKSDRPDRPFHKEFKSDRPFHKEFDRSAPRFGDDRPARRFGGDEERSHRSSRTLEMFDVTCDKCGKECQVPFRPTRGKPVFCSDCFKKGDTSEPRRFEPRAEKPDNELQQINRKLDKIMQALDIE